MAPRLDGEILLSTVTNHRRLLAFCLGKYAVDVFQFLRK
jgi:hypothetical protein